MYLEKMNTCLKSELSAIETYHQALEKERDPSGHEQIFQELSTILQGHQQAASQLESHIRQLGATPVHDSGAWGTLSKVVMGTAKLFGDKAALKALKEGEENGLKEYQELRADTNIPVEITGLIDNLVAHQRAHIQTLDGLMSRI